MTPEQQAEMERLVRLIQQEQDHKKFIELVSQLNDLLDAKEQRLTKSPPKQQ